MKKNKIIIGSTMIMIAIGLAACGKSNSASQTSNNGTTKPINWMETADLSTLDPSKVADAVTSNTISNIQQGLLVSGNNGKINYGIAKSYDVSKDGKTYTFHLRDAKWSNGEDVTADDFVYGIQRTVDPKTTSQSSYDMDHIKNYDEVQKGTKPVTDLGVYAPNKHTVVFNLSSPQPYFKYLVTGTDFFPQKKAYVEEKGSKFGSSSDNDIYDGPFTMTGWNGTNDTWNLVKNKYYWNAKNTKIDKVKVSAEKDSNTAFNEYQSGQLDEMMLSSKEQVKHFKNSPEYHQRTNSGVYFIEMNEKKVPAFRNSNIRKAMSMIINRSQFTKDVMGDGSVPAKGIAAQGISYNNGNDFADASYVKDAVTYNKAKAIQYWKKGMKEIGKKSITIDLLYDDTTLGKSVNEFLQNVAFSQLPGLKVTTTTIPMKNRMARQNSGNFDITVAGWETNYPDPISYLQLMTSDSSTNYGKWSNKEYDQLVKAASTTDANNPAKRWNDMVKAEKILMNEQGIIPFYQRSQPQVLKTNIKNVGYSATGAMWYLGDAYVEK
ncbi:peptide ABC transporter substrate-binding protein [Apilactobacillus kunkeei]|uniref:peptide ABC transporter substrate-binding protein n=1 Tax=Apilactobacillus kunkeei TaxID=148814 RepID=UPI0015E86805|nr:peptide ABC transporter substrate-binding protein [Apilactobacillus kunkeei]MCK8625691.1 peptide ABC transporter substrate-binding protein [Apilactobacillus kunkeei]